MDLERVTPAKLRSSALFFLIGNIPGRFRSSDLRSFFSQLIEKKAFLCFHYRHRPELLAEVPGTAGHDATTSVRGDVDGPEQEAGSNAAPRSCCCVVAVAKGAERELYRLYHGRNWAYPSGELLRARVKISNLAISLGVTRRSDTGNKPAPSQAIPWGELRALPELNPPNVMPRGNVGTPLATFVELIRACKLPPRVIRKLQLEFPKGRTKKRYGAVGLDYGTGVLEGESADGTGVFEGVSAGGTGVFEGVSAKDGKEGDGGFADTYQKEAPQSRRLGSPAAAAEGETIPSDDDHDAEEWERYEAFHEDVDKQGRIYERLYEEEMEVVWDKGSSGLVFYTDAFYWDQQEGDFDEKCSQEDDWDVDMAGYYDNEGGDKDSRDLMAIKVESRLREGKDSEGIGMFEKHTTGMGSRILRKSGWREGAGIGATHQGISVPVEVEGQLPHSKRGLGYRGEKIESLPTSKRRRQQASKDVIISTVYDRPEEEESTPCRTASLRTIKYREAIKFRGGGVLKEEGSTSQHS